jgi:hypothetical protein
MPCRIGARRRCAKAGGHATLFRGGDKAAVGVFRRSHRRSRIHRELKAVRSARHLQSRPLYA